MSPRKKSLDELFEANGLKLLVGLMLLAVAGAGIFLLFQNL